MFPERETVGLVGSMPLGISGSLAEFSVTRTGNSSFLMTCGSTVLANGHGWAARTTLTNREPTELREPRDLATFLAHEITPRLGSMPPETFGSLVEIRIVRSRPALSSTTYGSTSPECR